MSTIFSKIQLLTVGCLAATALTGAFNVPSASASDYNSGSIHADRGDDRFRDRDRDHDRDYDRDHDRNGRYEERRESRACRYLRRRIEEAREHRNYRLAARLEREYRRECSRHHRR
jgi:Ni/Co efflux regulator RcnB